MRAILAALAVSAVVVGAYVALGGGSYRPARPPDPCTVKAEPAAGGLTGTLERVGLNALAASACELGVSRERLLLALSGDRKIGISDQRRTAAFRAGLREAVDEEERAGRLGSAQAYLLRQTIAVLPVDALFDRLFGKGL
jgi:hypothetical protein